MDWKIALESDPQIAHQLSINLKLFCRLLNLAGGVLERQDFDFSKVREHNKIYQSAKTVKLYETIFTLSILATTVDDIFAG